MTLLDPASAEALALLDGLDTQAPAKPQQKPPQWWDELRLVSELHTEAHHDKAMESIPGETTATLLDRIKWAHRLPALWALHVELDARGIPPCVRSAQRIGTHQADFITTLADLLWLAKRYPGHVPLKQRMRRVLQGEPNTDAWHRAALWAYQDSTGKPYMLAKWLALTDEQRAQTATMPAKAQANERRALPDQLEAIKEKLLDHALDHPDRSGRTKPYDLASHRTELVRLFVLLGRSVRATHEYLQAVDSLTASVRALRKQLDLIASIYGANRAPLAPPRPRSALKGLGN